MPAAELYKLAQAKDAKTALIEAVGDLSGINIFSGRVLVGIYIRPEKTTGGLYLPDSQKKEDVYQAAVGLVLKKGNLAFKDDEANDVRFHGQDVNVGDWVSFSPGDGKRTQINGVDCRLIEDALIHMVVADPEIITHRT